MGLPKGQAPVAKGIKGRSGRKGYGVEIARKNVIKKSWNILDTKLEDIDDVGIALPIALKDMTNKIGADPDNPLIVQISETIAKKRGITSKAK